MDLPRMPSHASLSPPGIQLLSDLNRQRTPISRKLLSASSHEPQFAVIPSASHFQPSCKREEARALQNLRRRVQALRVVQDNRQEAIEVTNASKNSNSSYLQLDNRPQLLQKERERRNENSANGEENLGVKDPVISIQLRRGYPLMPLKLNLRDGFIVVFEEKQKSTSFLGSVCATIPQYRGVELASKKSICQKILSNKPVSMVLDISDIQTAWQDSDFITDCLCWHNVYRQRHSSPPLTMSSELCDVAQTWANHLAHTNRFYYRTDKDIGQNLFCRPANNLQNDVSGQEVAAYWYTACRQYNFNKEPDVLHANVNAGHFTQIVWRSSQCFGIGKARSRTGKIVVVAHYSPAGNITGMFDDNVFPPSPDYPLLPTTPRFYISSEVTESETSTSASSSTTQ